MNQDTILIPIKGCDTSGHKTRTKSNCWNQKTSKGKVCGKLQIARTHALSFLLFTLIPTVTLEFGM